MAFKTRRKRVCARRPTVLGHAKEMLLRNTWAPITNHIEFIEGRPTSVAEATRNWWEHGFRPDGYQRMRGFWPSLVGW